MRPIERETNIEVFRQYTHWLQNQVRDLSKELARLRDGQEPSSQEWLDKSLKDQLSRLQQKFFGFGRETRSSQSGRPVGHAGDQLRLHSEHQTTESVEVENPDDRPEAAVYEFKSEDLAEESVLRGIDANCKPWDEMKNFYKESVEITVTERVYKKVVIKQKRYRLKDEYNTTGKEVIITAPGPVKLKSGCQYSMDFGLAVVSDKYEYHLPLERQRRKMEAAGLDVEVKTLYGLCETVAEHCESVIESIRQDILNDFCAVHLDETSWQILGTQESGQMWVMSNRLASYYRFEPTRSGLVAEEMLKGYVGAVVTDGFAGYNRLRKSNEVRVGHCWAHVRREFFERLKDFPVECEQALDLIDRIFALESRPRNFDELRELRRTEIAAVVGEFQKWLLETKLKFMPGDGISKAIDYTHKFWPELTLFLSDLSVPIDNNDAERALRHAVMGRKNFAGSKTINGADTAATLYTVIESAKKAGIQPREYLKYVITEKWNKRQLLSPQQLGLKFRNSKSRVTFPSKDNWKV
jgi:transposase